MANEKLVGSVYFRGGKIGSSELIILDTSFAATYDITYTNGGVSAANALDVTFGKTFIIQLKQNPSRPDVPKVWFKYLGADTDKIQITSDTVAIGTHNGTVTMDPTGTGLLKLDVKYYPSLVNMNASIEFYHDSAMTQLLATIPVRSLLVTGTKLRLIAARSQASETEIAPVGIFNNDFILIDYTDDNIKSGKVSSSIPFKATMNNVAIAAGTYPQGGPTWMYGQWYDNIPVFANGGWITSPRQANPIQRGSVNMVVTMGGLTVTNSLMDSIVADLKQDNIVFGVNSPLMEVNGPLPAGVTNKRSNTLSFGYAFVKQVPVFPADQDPANYMHTNYGPANNYITNLVINRNNPEGLLVQPKGSEIKSLNNAQGPETFGTSTGTLTYLAWDKTLLTNATKRRQFGKYQKTLSVISKWSVIDGTSQYRPILTDLNTIDGQPNLTLDLVQDPIATAQYGALTSLSFSTLAVFVFSSRDISIAANQFDSTGCVSFGGQRTASATVIAGDFVNGATLPPEQPSNPQDRQFRTDFLFIRNNGSSEKNTFTDDVPYPRFINVQTVRGYEAFKFTPNYGTFWDFYLDPSLGINLMDSRYSFITTVQNDSDWGYEFYVKQQIDLVGRSPNHLKFRSGFPTTQPSMSLAIIDKGPA